MSNWPDALVENSNGNEKYTFLTKGMLFILHWVQERDDSFGEYDSVLTIFENREYIFGHCVHFIQAVDAIKNIEND